MHLSLISLYSIFFVSTCSYCPLYSIALYVSVHALFIFFLFYSVVTLWHISHNKSISKISNFALNILSNTCLGFCYPRCLPILKLKKYFVIFLISQKYYFSVQFRICTCQFIVKVKGNVIFQFLIAKHFVIRKKNSLHFHPNNTGI